MSSELPAEFRNPEAVGSGGSAVVYRCIDQAGDTVAVKLFSQPLEDPTAGDAEFRSECRTALELSAHPGVIGVRAAGITANARPWLAMEFAAGGTVSDLIRRQGPLRVDRALELAAEVADTVAWAHSLPSPVIHGDLKPSNVLLDGHGRPKLGDFGVAKRLGGRRSVTVAQFTQSYAAPEVLSEGRTSPAADVWSLGATLFEMLLGVPPFVLQVNEGPLPFINRVHSGLDIDAIPASVPPIVAQIIRGALTVERAQRTPSAAKFAAAVRSAQRSLGFPATPTLPAPASIVRRQLRFVGYADAVRYTAFATLNLRQAVHAPEPEQRAGRDSRVGQVAAMVTAVVILLIGAGVIFALSRKDPTQRAIEPGATAAVSITAKGAPTVARTVPTGRNGGGVGGGGAGSTGGVVVGGGNTPPPQSSASPSPAPNYPPITSLAITTSANETVVNFTISVNPNGKSAAVHITTNQQSQTFTTGTGVWTWSSSDNVGYNVTDFINVDVTDPDRVPVSGSASQNTPCAYKNNNGQWPTFSGNGGSWAVPAFSQGQQVTYNLPDPVRNHLQSITGNGAGAFHIVTYGGDNQSGNLAHWDGDVSSGQLPNTPGYYPTASIKVYFNRQC